MEWFKDAPTYVDAGDALGGPKADMFADWGMRPEAETSWEEGGDQEEEEEGVLVEEGEEER